MGERQGCVVRTSGPELRPRYHGSVPPGLPGALRQIPPLPSADRVSAKDDAVDQCRDGFVKLRLTIRAGIVGMCGGGIAQDAEDFVFGQNVAVVQRKQERFADGKRRRSGDIVNF